MKRYILFAGDHYYPSANLDDIRIISDDLEEVKSEALRIKGYNSEYYYDWASIIDTHSGTEIIRAKKLDIWSESELQENKYT